MEIDIPQGPTGVLVVFETDVFKSYAEMPGTGDGLTGENHFWFRIYDFQQPPAGFPRKPKKLVGCRQGKNSFK
jgi:hypothetical protein